jgi:hypothetical protein
MNITGPQILLLPVKIQNDTCSFDIAKSEYGNQIGV